MANQAGRARPPLPSMKKGSGTRRAITPKRNRTPNPLAALGPARPSGTRTPTPVKAIAVPRKKSGCIAAAPAAVPRPRERAQTVPTPEALEFELLEELKRKQDSAPPNDGPVIEVSDELPKPRAANHSAPALEILHKPAPRLELASDLEVTLDKTVDELPGVLAPGRQPANDADDLPGVLDPKRGSSVGENHDANDELDALLETRVQSGPDEPPRSSRTPAIVEPSVVITDELSRVGPPERAEKPSLSRDELPTEPPDDSAGFDWQAEVERQVPTIPPARGRQPKKRRWRLAVLALLVGSAVAGYFRFPAEYAHAWQVTSSQAKLWGGTLQQELVKKGWL